MQDCKECAKDLTDFEKATSDGLCAECKFKRTEQEHGRAQAELDQIRAKARERNWRFMKKKKSEGGRQLSAIVTKECYDILTRLRDNAQQAGQPESFGVIIEKALSVYVSTLNQSKQGDITNVCSNDKTNPTIKPKDTEKQRQIPEPNPEPETDIELPDYLINVGPDITTEDQHKIILQMEKDFPTKGKGTRPNAKKRIELLNAAGVLVDGGPFTDTRQFANQGTRAKEWAKKTGYKP